MAKLKKVTTLKTLDDVNTKLADLKIVKAKLQKIEAELNLKRTELENKYTPELTALREHKLLIESDVELWADDNKNKLDKKRSWDMLHGSVGYRSSTALAKNKKVTWDEVKEKIKNLGGKLRKYLRIKEEVAKDELREDITAGNLSLDDAALICVYIEERDNFYIDLTAIEVDGHSN